MDKSNLTIIAIIFIISLSIGATGAPIDVIRILKISGADQTAVIKTPSGKAEVIKVGDLIGDDGRIVDGEALKKKKETGLRVTEIAAGRVVFEDGSSGQAVKIIVTLANGTQHISRLKSLPDKSVQPKGSSGGSKGNKAGN